MASAFVVFIGWWSSPSTMEKPSVWTTSTASGLDTVLATTLGSSLADVPGSHSTSQPHQAINYHHNNLAPPKKSNSTQHIASPNPQNHHHHHQPPPIYLTSLPRNDFALNLNANNNCSSSTCSFGGASAAGNGGGSKELLGGRETPFSFVGSCISGAGNRLNCSGGGGGAGGPGDSTPYYWKQNSSSSQKVN